MASADDRFDVRPGLAHSRVVPRPRLLTALTALAVAIALVVAGRGWAIGTCAAAMIPDAVRACPCCPTDDAPPAEPQLTARCCDVAPTTTAGGHPPLTLTPAPHLAAPPAEPQVIAASAPTNGQPQPVPPAPRATGPPRWLALRVLRL